MLIRGISRIFLLVAGLIILTACEAVEDTVVFGQAHTVGISAGQAPGAAAPEFVLGYKDANVALLPAAVKDATGNPTPLGGTTKGGGSEFGETFSVFGQFSANSALGGQQNPDVGLGKFFATGIAAQKLASGFACNVSGGTDKSHCHSTTSHAQPAKPTPSGG